MDPERPARIPAAAPEDGPGDGALDPSPEIDFAFDGEFGIPRDADEIPRLS